MTWELVFSRQMPEGSDVLTMRALTGIKQTSITHFLSSTPSFAVLTSVRRTSIQVVEADRVLLPVGKLAIHALVKRQARSLALVNGDPLIIEGSVIDVCRRNVVIHKKFGRFSLLVCGVGYQDAMGVD